MKKQNYLPGVLVLLFLCGQLNAQTKKVLFLGDSLTTTNNMPDMLYQLALSGGDTLIYDVYAPFDHSLQDHSNDPVTYNKINSNNWDYVVLQENTQLLGLDPYVEVYPYVIKLDSAIIANDSCRETIFFMPQAYKWGDLQNCPTNPYLCTFGGTQDTILGSCMYMMKTRLGIIAPVGSAYWLSIQTNPVLDLYQPDSIHPNLEGSYLTACALYATIWNESPIGLPYTSTITFADASYLQHIADSTVIDSSVWFYGASNPIADFDHFTSFLSVSFTNQSHFDLTYFWDFGDGTTSTEENPLHMYAAQGFYYVCLTVSNGCLSDTYCDTVCLVPGCGNSILEYKQPDFKIYPNPALDVIRIEYDSPVGNRLFRITDIEGRELLSGHASRQTVRIDVSALAPGMYCLISGGLVSRFVKN